MLTRKQELVLPEPSHDCAAAAQLGTICATQPDSALSVHWPQQQSTQRAAPLHMQPRARSLPPVGLPCLGGSVRRLFASHYILLDVSDGQMEEVRCGL